MREYNETRYDFSFDTAGLQRPPSVAPARQRYHFACDVVLLVIMFVVGVLVIVWSSQHPVASVDLVSSVFVFENATRTQAIPAISQIVDEFCAGNIPLAKTSLYGFNVMQLALNASTRLDLWELILCVVVTTVLAQLYRVGALQELGFVYEPDGPDLGRWLEYTVSSPLQVVIVAAAFHTREAATLIVIGLLQATLTWTGYSIEKCVAAWRPGYVQKLEISVSFALATAAHVAIWSLIKLRTDNEHKLFNHDACTQDDPDSDRGAALDLIFYSQCILFSLFPVVCLCSIIYAVVWLGKPPDAAFWHTLARVYSFLSVFTKSFLVVAFLVYAKTFDGLQDAMITTAITTAITTPALTLAPEP